MRIATRWRWTVGFGVPVLALGLVAYLFTPRSSGLEPDWAARAVEGTVVGERALVGGGNTAVDLRTGKTITLGSVQGGTAFLGDERLVIAKGNRVDSVRLDATARWTWQAPSGTTVTPVAAGGGSTVALVCTKPKSCTLSGIGAQGRQEWTLPTTLDGSAPAAPALPSVLVTPTVPSGIELTDPVTGRQTVRPGGRSLTTPAGVVVVPTEQQGTCVVAAYRGADPLWVRALGPCPGGALPGLKSDGSWIHVTWPGTVTTLATDSGRTVASKPGRRPAGTVASSQDVVATRTTTPVRTNPLRWGQHDTVLEVRDAVGGEVRARLVTAESLDLLSLRPEAIVVREGDRLIRYTLSRP